MYHRNTKYGSRLAVMFLPIVLAAGIAHAEIRDSVPGYTEDTGGNVLRTETGDCVRTGNWKSENADVVGCDNYTLDAKVEIIKGDPTGYVNLFVIPAATLFAFDSAEVTEAGEQAMEEYRAKLAPALSDAYAGVIIGHTDSKGEDDYNMGLSLRRAEAVQAYLVGTGTAPEKLRVIGRGENDPVASNDTPEGQALNRRVEVIVIDEVRGLDAMRFPSVAMFPRRSAELTDQGQQLLEKHRADAREQLESAAYVEIIGHTDDVGDDDYNQELSEQRAATVRNYLVLNGADVSKIVALGAGEKMPIASNNTPEGRAENRRVEILILGRVK